MTMLRVIILFSLIVAPTANAVLTLREFCAELANKNKAVLAKKIEKFGEELLDVPNSLEECLYKAVREGNKKVVDALLSPDHPPLPSYVLKRAMAISYLVDVTSGAEGIHVSIYKARMPVYELSWQDLARALLRESKRTKGQTDDTDKYDDEDLLRHIKYEAKMGQVLPSVLMRIMRLASGQNDAQVAVFLYDEPSLSEDFIAAQYETAVALKRNAIANMLVLRLPDQRVEEIEMQLKRRRIDEDGDDERTCGPVASTVIPVAALIGCAIVFASRF